MTPTVLRQQHKLSDTASSQDAVTVRMSYRPPFSWEQILTYLQPRLITGVDSVQLT
ncbi:MAG: hypothetical protein H7240_01970 [Glaciimonas sp.]|nr:hypothetical protein [Glaciimonas sp.]